MQVSPSPTRDEIKPVVKLGVPLMIGLAASLMIGIVDTIMISPLGTVPLAAAGITTAALIILISALWGVITVISVRISQADGAGSPTRVSEELRAGLAASVVAGGVTVALMIAAFPLLGPIGQPAEVIAILFPYWLSMAVWIMPFILYFSLKALFDAVGREWTGVVISYVGVVANIPANYAFIYIFDLGLVGAGYASILSQTLSLAAGYGYWRLAPSMAAYRAPARITWARVGTCLKESLPLCIGYAGEGGAYAMIGIMMGWLGATALAAHQVVNAASGLAYVVPLGLAGAVSIRVGQAVGQERRGRLRPILKAGIGVSVVWQTVISILFITFGGIMAASLSTDPAVVALATLLFIAVALLQVADGIQGTSLGALRGMSDNSIPTAITLIAYWALALPLAYVFAFWLGYGALGLWAGYTVGLAVAAIALPWRYWRLTRVGLKSPA
ncbi:MAG: MATE family efflux transporter [Pseudomonadota bacterium]